MSAIFYTAELSLPDEDFKAFYDWYCGRHSADLFRSTFYTVTLYKTVEGDLKILDVYQADSFDAFSSEGYQKRGRDPYAKQKLANGSGFANTIYGYLEGPSTDPKKIIDADWLSVLRFNADEAAAEKLAKEIEGLDVWNSFGVRPKAIRVVVRTHNHPTLPSNRERYAIVLEWDACPPSLDPVQAAVAANLGIAADQVARTTGRRLYPWPDNTEFLQF